VRRGDDEGHRGISPIQEYPIGHDLEKNKGKYLEEEKNDEVLQYASDKFTNIDVLKKALKRSFKPGKKLRIEDIDKHMSRI